jgi:hypothetical protein
MTVLFLAAPVMAATFATPFVAFLAALDMATAGLAPALGPARRSRRHPAHQYCQRQH